MRFRKGHYVTASGKYFIKRNIQIRPRSPNTQMFMSMKSIEIYIICKESLDEEFMYSASLVESNRRLYCARHIDNNITDHTEDMTKKKYIDDIKQRTKIIHFNSFDEKAKKIDKYALVMMPVLFMVTSILYWSTHLRKG